MALFAAMVAFGLAATGVQGELNCGAVKNAYKAGACCGLPDKEFEEDRLYPQKDNGYTMCLTTLADNEVADMQLPEQSCYQPVTLQALRDVGEMNYSWISQSRANSNAPNGAFVYQLSGGGLRYKKIEIGATTCDGVTLTFSGDKAIPRLQSFAEAQLVGMAAKCNADMISVESLKSVYSMYSWAQLPGQSCGMFVYQPVNGGPLVYKEC